MSPQDLKIQALERQVAELRNFMLSFNSLAQLSPQAQRTIKRIATTISLSDLADVDTTGVSNGQVIKYNSTSGEWEPGNDNT